MATRLVIALELDDNDRLLQPSVDGDDVIDGLTPEDIAGEFIDYASGFHITETSRYELVAVEHIERAS